MGFVMDFVVVFVLSRGRESRMPSHPPAWWEELISCTGIQRSLAVQFQPSDLALMFKYKCVLLCITENSVEGGESLKFSNKQCRVAWIPGWEISPSQCVGKCMSTC